MAFASGTQRGSGARRGPRAGFEPGLRRVSAPGPMEAAPGHLVAAAPSGSEKVQRLGELGARGVGREPLDHGADPVTPIQRAVVVR